MARRKKAASRKARKARGQALQPATRIDTGPPERWQYLDDDGRLQVGRAALVDTLVDDGKGGMTRGRAARDSDTIARLLGNGTISLRLATAARHFQQLFHLAQLDGIQAARLERMPAGQAGDNLAQLGARRLVARAIGALGGHGALGASAVWYVVGVGDSVKDWAQRQRLGRSRMLNERTAMGILIAALEALAAHFGKAA